MQQSALSSNVEGQLLKPQNKPFLQSWSLKQGEGPSSIPHVKHEQNPISPRLTMLQSTEKIVVLHVLLMGF